MDDRIEGKAKEAEGKLTGDKGTEAEGKAQGALGKAKDAVDKVSATPFQSSRVICWIRPLYSMRTSLPSCVARTL